MILNLATRFCHRFKWLFFGNQSCIRNEYECYSSLKMFPGDKYRKLDTLLQYSTCIIFLFAIGQTFFFCLKCHLFIVPIIKVVATFKAHEALRLSLKNNYTQSLRVNFLHRFCFEKRAYFQILMSFPIKMDSARKFKLTIQLDLLILIFLLFRFADFCQVEITSNFFP